MPFYSNFLMLRTHIKSWVPIAHACNPRYLVDWDQEDCGSRPAQANSSWDSISKITRAKWMGGAAALQGRSHMHMPVNTCNIWGCRSVVELMFSVCKAMGKIPSTYEKRKKVYSNVLSPRSIYIKQKIVYVVVKMYLFLGGHRTTM
jgi:hypothetical protein